MDILGNPETGWFAQVAHGCEAAGRGTLNFVSCGGQWGDKMYGTMDRVVDQQVTAMNQNAINNALQHGATQQQALQAGSAEMERLASPQNLGDLGHLLSTGASASWQTVKEVATKAVSPELGLLVPVLIGAGVLGGAYLLADTSSDNKPSPRRRRESREAA